MYDFFKNTYNIPEFQRRYSWGKENVEDLLNSVLEAILEPNSEFDNYIGSIMITKETNKSFYYVLDGQQRLTTIIIAFVALSEKVNQLKAELETLRLPTELAEAIFDLDQKYKDMLIKKEGILRTNQTNRDVLISFDRLDSSHLTKLINKKDIDKMDKRSRITKSYNITCDLIDKHYIEYLNEKELDDNIQEKLIFMINYFSILYNDTYILRTELDDIADSFAVFEATNTTGLQLNPFDLINGYISNKLRSNNSELLPDWIEIVTEYLERDLNLTDFVFYWANSKDKQYSKRDLYKYVKSIGESKDPEGFQNFALDLLDNFDKLDKYMLSDQPSYRHIKILGRKKLYSVFLALTNKSYSEEEIETFMMEIIKYSVMELNLGGKSPGIFQYKVRKIIDEIISSEEVLSFEDILTSEKESVRDIINDFKSYDSKLFSGILSGESNNDNLYKSLLIMLVDKEQPSSTIKYESIDLEHIFPQNPHKDWSKDKKWKKVIKSPEAKAKYTGMIGNMMLLNTRLNKRISNSYIDKKKVNLLDDIENNKYDALKNASWNMIEFDEFSPKYIKHRTSTIIEKIIEDEIFRIK